MHINEVPQEPGILEKYHKVHYAIDENGKYVQVKSMGCDVVNTVNAIAWDVVHQRVEEARQNVLSGKESPLAYYMANFMMDIGLLSEYVNISKWRIRRHLKPSVFKKLNSKILQCYADVFEVSVAQLKSLPLKSSTTD